MVSLVAFSYALLGLTPLCLAGKTTNVSKWGDNPSKLPAVLIYTPDKIADKPAVVLAVCFLFDLNPNIRLLTVT